MSIDIFNYITLSEECQSKLQRLTDRILYKENLLFTIEQIYNNSKHLSPESQLFNRFADCGKYLVIKSDNGEIKKANFCKQRLCPVCNYIKSTVNWHRIKNCVEYLKTEYNYKFVFMTLTVKNCSAEDLQETIDNLLQSFRRLYNRRSFKKSIKGSIRGLEITYNKAAKTFHPHIHLLCAVPEDYFDSNSKNYVTIEKLRKWWSESAKLNYYVQVDIRGIDQSDNAVAEVAKYAIKMSSLIDDTNKLNEIKATQCIYEFTYGRRLIAALGCFKKAMQVLNIKDFDEIENDIEITDNDIIQCLWSGEKFDLKKEVLK